MELIQSILLRHTNVRKVLVDGSQLGMVSELEVRYRDGFPNYYKLRPEVQDRLIKSELPLVVAVNWQHHRKYVRKNIHSIIKGNV